MSILVNKDSRIIVQGITGSEGSFHRAMFSLWWKCCGRSDAR